MKGKSLIISIFSFTFIAAAQDLSSSKYDNRFIQFYEYGRGEPLIILSGGPGNDCRQEEDVAIKASSKFHTILLEQRGTGKSMPPILDENSINLDFALKDILFVMDSLKLKKVILYGHSWGALLAVSFAVQYPDKVKSLVFVGPGPMSMSAKDWNQIPLNRLAKLTVDQKKRYFELFFKSRGGKTSNEETIELVKLKNNMNIYDTTNTEKVFTKINKGNNNVVTYDLMIKDLEKIKFDLTKEIPKLKLSVTIITGKEDPLAFLTTAFQSLYPNTNIIWVDKSGHFPMFEQPEFFYPKFLEALNQN